VISNTCEDETRIEEEESLTESCRLSILQANTIHNVQSSTSRYKVIQVSEARTSQYCRKCYQKGVRKIQGLFTCAKCGEENADRNAAFNIAYRALGYISKVGVTVNIPNTRTFASVDRNAMMTKEAPIFKRW
jgi:ribosomal protein L37AE/L43A